MKAAIFDFIERAGWSAGQVFFATLLSGTVISVAKLPWEKAGQLALGAGIASVVLTGIQYLPMVANFFRSITSPEVFFWVDTAVRLVKTFLATLAGLWTVGAFNPVTFDWPPALNTAVVAMLAALSKGLLARGGRADHTGQPPSPEPASSNPSTLPRDLYVATVRNERAVAGT